MKSHLKKLVPASAALGAILMSSAARADAMPDAWITTKAKLALFTANAGNATMVHVDTVDGRILLYGKVTSAAQKKKAGGIARGVSGATGVSNMLQVVDPAEMKTVEATDDAIKAAVQQQLKDDPNMPGNDILVKSVNKGTVLLTGETPNMSDHLEAVEVAYFVPGVRSVSSEIKTSKDVAPYDMTPTAHEVKQSARASWIIVASKIAFLGDPEVPATEVGVDVSRNEVTLFGIVPSEASKSAAEADVKKIDSTVIVKNELQIVPKSQKRLVDAKDEQVKHSVEKALSARKELKDVAVDVKNGVVRLSGTVGSGWQRLKAGFIARTTKGVHSVEDNLKV